MTRIIIFVVHILFFLILGVVYFKVENGFFPALFIATTGLSAAVQWVMPDLKAKERYVVFLLLSTVLFSLSLYLLNLKTGRL